MGATLPSGYRLRSYDELPSTSTTAMAALAGGEPPGLWVTAARQSAGKGRRGRVWATERGNLAASLALRDPSPPKHAATLSFVAGIALHQAIVDVTGPVPAGRLALKWPNDLMLDGRKLAGILIEGETPADGGFAVVVGIGVNCVSHPDVGGAYPATDLAEAGLPVSADDLFPRLALRMADAIAAWDRGRGFAATRRDWLVRAAGVGERLTVRLADGNAFDGRFDDVDEEGRLVLRFDDDTVRAIAAGEVFFPAAAGAA